MKNTLKTIALVAILTVSSAQAGAPVVKSQPAPTKSDVTAKIFAASLLNDSTETYGAGLAVETKLVQNLYGEVVATLLEGDVYSAGVNLTYYVPVASNLSVYGLLGASYEFSADSFNAGVGGGVSYALSPTLSLFADGTYTFYDEKDTTEGGVGVRLGLGLKF
jgi:hypothetical protein